MTVAVPERGVTPPREPGLSVAARWARWSTPLALSRIVLLLGLVDIGSALSPGIHDRARLLTELVPHVFPAAATTGTLAAGALMVVTSRAVSRCKRRAWLLCVVLAIASIGLNLLKGLDIEEALLGVVLLALLITGRGHFTARPDPRSLSRVAVVGLLGPVMATALGTGWLCLVVRGQAAGTTLMERVQQAALGLLGVPGPIRWRSPHDGDTTAVALAVLGFAVLLTLLLVVMAPADGPHALTDHERATLGGLLARHSGVDSLSYFATRGDRSLLMAANGRAGLSYRVIGTVSLAAGDPVGDPDAWPGAIAAWIEECDAYGWTPAVLGASERAAEVYRRVGLDALELGDEAVLHTETFSLEGRAMRGVRQAVSRCERAGLRVACARVRDLPVVQCEEIRRAADAWRVGAERGFSMALGRVADRGDPEAVVVTARDAEGALHGVLGLVPWGSDGLSLDVMRRRSDSSNGVVELMVAGLAAEAAALGVRRVSLNFAVFRGVFARVDRVGAGPVLRLWCAVLRHASRWWQIETLYRSNAKYQPAWCPRFLCFRRATDLPRVLTAAMRAEGFLTLPGR